MSVTPASPRKGSPRRPKSFRLATPVALAVSLLAHLSIFLVVGSVVIFEGKIPPSFFEAFNAPLAEGEETTDVPTLLEEDILPDPVDSPLEDLSTDPMDRLSDSSTSDLITSSAVDNTLSSSSAIRSFSGTPKLEAPKLKAQTKTASDKKGPGIPRTANIFGRTVQSAKFGAILDISFSTHSTIDVAVNEITEGFPDAVLVLAPGCGMNATKGGEIIEGQLYEKNLKDYGVEGLMSSATFLENLLRRNRNFKNLWDDAKRDGRGYVLHVPFDPKEIEDQVEEKLEQIEDTDGDPKDARIFEIYSTQYAFTFLESQGCDTIYWMADFADRVQENVVKDLAKDLKRAGIKVIQHDFKGGDHLNDKAKSYLYRETGGEKIVGAGRK